MLKRRCFLLFFGFFRLSCPPTADILPGTMPDLADQAAEWTVNQGQPGYTTRTRAFFEPKPEPKNELIPALRRKIAAIKTALPQTEERRKAVEELEAWLPEENTPLEESLRLKLAEFYRLLTEVQVGWPINEAQWGKVIETIAEANAIRSQEALRQPSIDERLIDTPEQPVPRGPSPNPSRDDAKEGQRRQSNPQQRFDLMQQLNRLTELGRLRAGVFLSPDFVEPQSPSGLSRSVADQINQRRSLKNGLAETSKPVADLVLEDIDENPVPAAKRPETSAKVADQDYRGQWFGGSFPPEGVNRTSLQQVPHMSGFLSRPYPRQLAADQINPATPITRAPRPATAAAGKAFGDYSTGRGVVAGGLSGADFRSAMREAERIEGSPVKSRSAWGPAGAVTGGNATTLSQSHRVR